MIKNYLKKCGYQNPKVNVVGYEQLNNIIEQKYPTLLLNLKNIYSGILYENIAQNSELRNQYFCDEIRQNIISSVQKLLLKNDSAKATHVRIIGASGIGKTRTVIEALNTEPLKNNCVYFENPEAFNNLNFLNNINKNTSVIIVIDECDTINCEKIFNNIEYPFTNIKLITIYNSNTKDTIRVDDDKCFIVEKLSDDKLLELIHQAYVTIPKRTIQKIIRLCEGFPRVALIVADNVHKNPEQYLDNLDNIWLKYVSNDKNINSDETKKYIKTLKIMSLFEKTGYLGQYNDEFNFVKEKINQLYGLTYGDIEDIVTNLIKKNILRGNSTLYISPRIFQNWLKAQHWENNKNFDYEKFKDKIPESLLQNFNHELFEISNDVKTSILNTQFAQNEDIIKKKDLFNSLAYEQNEIAFGKLEKLLLELPENEFQNLDSGFQSLLMHYAKNPEYFERSCNLLFKVACHEGKKWYSNKADSHFAELFTIFYSTQMATTYTALSSKSKYLNNLYEKINKDKSHVLIILKAIEQALQDPSRYNKMESFEINTLTQIHLKEPFVYTEIEKKYLINIFELILKIIQENSNKEILDSCLEIFKSTTFYMLQSDTLFDLAYEKYKSFINLAKYRDVASFIKTFNIAFKHNWFKKLQNTNLKKIKKLFKLIQITHNYDEFKTFCITNYDISEDKKLFNELMSKTIF